MKKLTILLLSFFCSIYLFAQHIKLSQQKLGDDFLIKSGQYEIYIHKKDMLQSIDEIDKKLKTDNSDIESAINDGSLKQVKLSSKAASEVQMIQLINSSLGAYLLIKGKAAIYKSNKQLPEISMDEAPPEAELDGTMSNIYFFAEIGSSNNIFHGKVRVELGGKK